MSKDKDEALTLVEEAMLTIRLLLDAHCKERDDTRRGCHCFHAVEHATARELLKRLKVVR